ncbi:MAG: endolytic transglycosylase MltG, partial [Gammaproteobacteria bacterium]|nr:endolytic transglycosylase MltG [Gammaproteobacteria bacterium]
RLVGAGERQVRRACRPCRLQAIAQLPVCEFQNVDVRRARGKTVGVRKKPSLGMHAGIAEPAHQFGIVDTLQGLSDAGVCGERTAKIGIARALDHRQGLEHHATLVELTKYVDGRGSGRNLVAPDLHARRAIQGSSPPLDETRIFECALRRGMRLQSDPTVIYGLGDRYDGDIRSRDLDTDTPYNSYTRQGLPPTPIALPGDEALRAATRPLETGELFFVATGRGDGSHAFSKTYDEHRQAVRRMLERQRTAAEPAT